MLSHYLGEAIANLEKLIACTQRDIDSIKEARHTELFSNSPEKERIISAFESSKAKIDAELRSIVNSGGSLGEMLSDEQKNNLDIMKQRLKTLKEMNKRLAKMVLAVSEFYNTLLTKMIPQDKSIAVGYNASPLASASSLFAVRG